MILFYVCLFLIFQFSVRGNTVIASLYAIHLDVTPFELGLIISTTALFPMVFGVYAGRASDRIGFRVPLVIGSLGAGLALILPYLFKEELLVLFISQSIFGFSHLLVLVTMQNLIGAQSRGENRSTNFGLLSLGISISNLFSPLLTGLSIDYLNYSDTYLILSAIAVIPGLILMFKFYPPQKELATTAARIQSSFIDLLRLSSLRNTFITSGIILTGIGIFEFYLPVFGSSLGFSASMIGIILSAHASAYFIVRLFMPVLVKKFGEEVILKWCLWITASSFIFIPYSQSFILLTGASFVLGLSLGCCQPLSIAMAYNRSPAGRTGEVLGLRLTINKIVQFFVPIAFGSVVSLLGFFTIFWSNALLFFMSGLLSSDRTVEDKKRLPKDTDL